MSRWNHRRSTSLISRWVCAITVLAMATTSCTSMHKVPAITMAGQPAWQVHAGDIIRVTLRDGGSSEFKVQSVTPEAIVATDGTRFEHANITSVERRGLSGGKTAGAVGAGLGIAALILVIAAGAIVAWVFSGGGGA